MQLQTGNGKGKNLTLGRKLNWRLNGGSRLRMKLQIGEDRLRRRRRRRLRARTCLRKKQLIFSRRKMLSQKLTLKRNRCWKLNTEIRQRN